MVARRCSRCKDRNPCAIDQPSIYWNLAPPRWWLKEWISYDIYCNIIQWFKIKKKNFIKAIFFKLENKWYNYLSLESILACSIFKQIITLFKNRSLNVRFPLPRSPSVFIFHRKFRWSYTFRQFGIREWSFWNGPEQLFHQSVYLPPPVYPQYDENCVEISSPSSLSLSPSL